MNERRNRLNISDIKVFVCCPGRNFVTVGVITDNGFYGLGDATVNGREMTVVAYLTEHVVPCLIGRDAHMIVVIGASIHYLCG